jgi:K+:H+ antiporter
VPPIVRLVLRMGRPETTIVASAGICFGFALIAEMAGYSVALGAFLAGSLVAESGQAEQIEHLIAPVRDIFGAVFFVSVGMMIDPSLIALHWVALVLLTVAVVVGKLFGVSIASVLSGIDTKTSIEAGMSLAQIGEFSFIIAGVGLQLHATRDFIYTLAIAVSAITTFMTPYMIRASGPVAEYVAKRIPRPLRVFESLYDSWMEQMRGPKKADATRPSLGWPIVSIIACATLIAGILVLNELDPLDITTAASDLEKITYFKAGLFVDLFALLICAAPMAGLYFASRRLAEALATRAIPQVSTSHHGAANALIELLQVTILFVVVIPLLAIVQPFIAPFEGIGIAIVTVILMTTAVARCVRKVQGHMRGAARLIADALAGSHAHSRDGKAYPVPGLGTLTPVRVRADSIAIGKKLSQLDLHGNTGAMIVAIGRGDGQIIVPTSEETIREGDVLELAGSHAAVRAAKDVLYDYSTATRELAASV